jgi:hypothetical protein
MWENGRKLRTKFKAMEEGGGDRSMKGAFLLGMILGSNTSEGNNFPNSSRDNWYLLLSPKHSYLPPSHPATNAHHTTLNYIDL